MTDYIRREDALKGVELFQCGWAEVEAVQADYIERLPAADAADVVHGMPVTEVRTRTIVGYHEEIGVFAADGSNLYRKNMVHVDIPYDHCPACGAILCSRWHNFCGKCGARMDGGGHEVD